MNNKDKLLIIGAGGHGRVVADIAMKMGRWKSIAFLDDKLNSLSGNLDIIGKVSDAITYKEKANIFVAIGDNSIREVIQTNLEMNGITIPSLVHPSAVIGSNVNLGSGTVIMAGAIINCCTHIGKGCIINTNTVIEHDNYIENYVHISPGVDIGGTVKIGKRSWLGIGSCVINNINICSSCIIGAGSVVIEDLKESGTYVGNPIRRI